jgi:hypothetical protein
MSASETVVRPDPRSPTRRRVRQGGLRTGAHLQRAHRGPERRMRSTGREGPRGGCIVSAEHRWITGVTALGGRCLRLVRALLWATAGHADRRIRRVVTTAAAVVLCAHEPAARGRPVTRPAAQESRAAGRSVAAPGSPRSAAGPPRTRRRLSARAAVPWK